MGTIFPTFHSPSTVRVRLPLPRRPTLLTADGGRVVDIRVLLVCFECVTLHSVVAESIQISSRALPSTIGVSGSLPVLFQ